MLTDLEKEMLKVLKDLYEHCAMPHKYWGENCNNKEATLAVQNGLALIAKVEGK